MHYFPVITISEKIRLSLSTVYIFVSLVQSTSFSFSVMVSPLIEVNSDKDFSSTLEAVAAMGMLA